MHLLGELVVVYLGAVIARQPAVPGLRFDMNHDGRIDVRDLLLALRQRGRRC